MLQLKKPPRLRPGDRVAAVSLSWGGAGDPDLLWRYQVGKARLQEQFGLEVVELPHTLAGTDWVYHHPEARAADLMAAFADPDIKGVFSCIGGSESIRLLPYIDFEVIRRNPKVLLGYSDTTIAHLFCLKGGLSSFYGPSILAEFAENVAIFDYTARHLETCLFSGEVLGEILPATHWTGERLEWIPENAQVQKVLEPNEGYQLIQGDGVAQGPLLGGCIEVLEMAKGTSLWPEQEAFEGAVLFFETSEETPEPGLVERWLRSYGSMGLLQRASALVLAKPYQGQHQEAYHRGVVKVLAELGLGGLPVLGNLSFGHNEPMCTLPYGAMARVDCQRRSFEILEPGVL